MLAAPARTVVAHRESRALTCGPAEHWFGYYDVTPWDASGTRLLAQAATIGPRMPRPDEAADLGVVDADGFHPFAASHAWNWQAGCMLQWLPRHERTVVYNDRRDGALRAVIRDLADGGERILPRPIAGCARDGRWASSVDFERLARARPVIGYAVADAAAAHDPAPADDGVWTVDLATGATRLVLSLADAVALAPGPDFALAAQPAAYAGKPGFEQPGAAGHRFEGAIISPGGTRMLVMHRWPRREPEPLAHFARHFWDRMLVVDVADGRARAVGEDGFHSHVAWMGEDRILSWSRHGGVDGMWIFAVDGDTPPQPFAQGLITADPHASFSPDGRFLLGDSYPDHERRRHLWICDLVAGVRHELGRFLSPAPYDRGPVRCDLHPRWSRDGRRVCFDSAHAGSRQMYAIDVADLTGSG